MVGAEHQQVMRMVQHYMRSVSHTIFKSHYIFHHWFRGCWLTEENCQTAFILAKMVRIDFELFEISPASLLTQVIILRAQPKSTTRAPVKHED